MDIHPFSPPYVTESSAVIISLWRNDFSVQGGWFSLFFQFEILQGCG
jgi:hypothetical protein